MTLRRKLIAFLFSLILTFCLLEGTLRMFDPWHIGWKIALRGVESSKTADGDPILAAGRYDLSGTIWTILPDGTRFVPGTNLNADCTIALIGDSFAFGYGLSDDETIAYHLSQALPDVHFINAAMYGYNSPQIRRAQARVHADGYVYLVYVNDTDAEVQPPGPPLPRLLWTEGLFYTEVYLKWYIIVHEYAGPPAVPDVARFRDDLAAMTANNDTLLFAFNEELREPLSGFDVQWIHWQYERLSPLDGHPNAAGQKAGAAAMLPAVSEFINSICYEGHKAD